MNNKLDFGKCLEQLLDILNISGIRIAKAINVDPSLVSKWKNGKRVVSPNSNYLDRISYYLSCNVTNESQERSIRDLATSLNIPAHFERSMHLKEYIYEILSTANQTSNIKYCKPRVENFSSKVNIASENIADLKVYESHPFTFKTLSASYNFPKNFELIVGHENIIKAGLDLLDSAAESASLIKDPIYITFYTNFDSFSNFEETYSEWIKILDRVLDKGNRIIKIIRLNESNIRNLKIIDEGINCIKSGRYYPYYIKNYHSLNGAVEFIIVPAIGALICLGSDSLNRFNNAFLVKDNDAINVLKGLLDQTLKQSLPLANTYNNGKLNFYHSLTKAEERIGNRYLYNSNLSDITVPHGLFSKYLKKRMDLSNNQISDRLICHKRRLEAFSRQIKNYVYYDIYSKSSIEDLIKTSSYFRFKTEPSDVLEHLENIVHMLEKYDNYKIGLMTNDLAGYFPCPSYMIKESHSVFLQCQSIQNDKATAEDTRFKNILDISITEPTLVFSHQNLFMNLWEQIPPINKEKSSVISWFKNQIKSLK
ncbi:helix-turn-helix transcriptional regulator [Wukongibacter baidiensis]|uniref:hypothetical protein n=1 Tax=Wukongibacter baidiensis TaxID=1723361 RepID=UPI003D7FF04E